MTVTSSPLSTVGVSYTDDNPDNLDLWNCILVALLRNLI